MLIATLARERCTMHRQNVALSPYNQDPRVLQSQDLPATVDINDATLREGEQAADVSLSLEDKVALAHRLDEVGVSEIEVGWPNRSARDREALRILQHERLRAKTQVLAALYGDDWRKEIDASLDCGASIVSLLQASSDARLTRAEGMTRDEALDRAVRAVEYAAGRGALIAYSPTDTTRTDLDFLKRLVTETVAAGAGRIAISDTVGAASPPTMQFLVEEITRWVDVPVQVHCHNDFGLALANSLAAVMGGARIVDATVNGLGERNGNVALDELAASLKLLYGVDTGVKLDAMFSLSRYVQELTRVAVPPNKPLVGDHAFSHKLDIHVERVMAQPDLFEPLDPEIVGNRRTIPLGSQTGPFVVSLKLEEHGLKATQDQIGEIAALVREIALEKRRSLTVEEFLTTARGVLN
jgi:isopropylmalate/homocitrate/citramalate synthase